MQPRPTPNSNHTFSSVVLRLASGYIEITLREILRCEVTFEGQQRENALVVNAAKREKSGRHWTHWVHIWFSCKLDKLYLGVAAMVGIESPVNSCPLLSALIHFGRYEPDESPLHLHLKTICSPAGAFLNHLFSKYLLSLCNAPGARDKIFGN